MIDSASLVPSFYSKESRDFQLFCRLFDLVFNYEKNNIQMIRASQDNNILELAVRTLGFFPKRNYSQEELMSVYKSFTHIIKYKGSFEGVTSVLRCVLRTSSQGKFRIEDRGVDSLTGRKILIFFVDDSIGDSDMCLIEELLSYILPINTSFVIQNASSIVGSETGRNMAIDTSEVRAFKVGKKTGRVFSWNSQLAKNSNDEDKIINNAEKVFDTSSGDGVDKFGNEKIVGDIRLSRLAKGDKNNGSNA